MPIVERWEREYDEKMPVLKTRMQDIAMNEKDFIVVKTGMQDIAMNEKDSIHVYFSQVCSGEDRHAGHQQCRSCYCNNEDSLVGTVITAAENKIPMLESSIGEGANLRNNSISTWDMSGVG
jgi:hypothetical protein